jgi:hypothetical protein
MAAKLEIATTTHSTDEIASIVSDFTSAPLLKRTQLFGGYSGSNYRVDFVDGSVEESRLRRVRRIYVETLHVHE